MVYKIHESAEVNAVPPIQISTNYYREKSSRYGTPCSVNTRLIGIDAIDQKQIQR